MAKGEVDLGGRKAPHPAIAWDPLVRTTHWAVAAIVLANYVLNREGGAVHIWLGWGLLAVLALRFAWGFVGPVEARFSAFPPRPFAALCHMGAVLRKLLRGDGEVPEYRSHNPAGAVMVYALWGALALVAVSGLVMTGGASPVRLAEEQAAVAAGDWSVLAAAGEEADDRGNGKWAEEVHEVAANLVVIFAFIHVAGVALESRALGRNLVRPMIGKS